MEELLLGDVEGVGVVIIVKVCTVLLDENLLQHQCQKLTIRIQLWILYPINLQYAHQAGFPLNKQHSQKRLC